MTKTTMIYRNQDGQITAKIETATLDDGTVMIRQYKFDEQLSELVCTDKEVGTKADLRDTYIHWQETNFENCATVTKE